MATPQRSEMTTTSANHRSKAPLQGPPQPVQPLKTMNRPSGIKPKPQPLKEQRDITHRNTKVRNTGASGSAPGSSSAARPGSMTDRPNAGDAPLKAPMEDTTGTGRTQVLDPGDRLEKGFQEQPPSVSGAAGDDVNISDDFPLDLSLLEGLRIIDKGVILDDNGILIGKVVEGDPADLVGLTVGSAGEIVDEDGDLIGRVELVPRAQADDGDDDSPGSLEEGVPLNSLEELAGSNQNDAEVAFLDIPTLQGLKCNKLGYVVTDDGTPVGEVIEGDAKRLARGGFQLDDQGQFRNHQGHVVGRAQPISVEEDEPGPFAGMGDIIVAEDGWVQDKNGRKVGKVVEGDAKNLLGHTVDDDGDILDKRGNVIGLDLSILEGKAVNKLGDIIDQNGVMLGRITDGNPKKLAGRKVDGKGQIWGDSGKVVGLAELIPEDEREKPEGPFYGLEGLTVKEGKVVDATGEVCGQLVQGDPRRLQGQRWSPDDLTPEELEKQMQAKEETDLAKKMSVIVQQALDDVGPLCQQIVQHIEKANHTPKHELDEEQLVKDVKPLIERAGNALQECKAALRALDPDGHIAETARARSVSHEATPAEHQLAELLRQLTQTVGETIDNGRRLIADMPHARKEINPLWALLSEPLFQVIAAVGLLLSGVLGLVSKLLDGLGLGGLLKGLLGGLGLDKLLELGGLGSVTQALGFDGRN
ncbi:hypothetical protein BJY04DRAFT_210784 [Aspergillus karnatakaensis]|uniref:DUF3659 domain-containing protein n=1 Tax=Aspergillus karnatakaensis TaxID=1810916 RepID=UPI003CCD1BC9